MKKAVSVLLMLIYCCMIFTGSTAAFGISAESAVLIEQSTGMVLYEKNADEKRGMASTTKIMTALVAIENGELDECFVVDDRAVGVEGTSLYIKKGEHFTLEKLLYALLLQSANDAAEAIAYRIAGSIPCFAELMNEKAAQMGLSSTHFANPHGLSAEEHYTTAHDLAVIAANALENEVFAKIVGTKTYKLERDGCVTVLSNHNKLLSQYKDCVGVKTGFTKSTGRCLVSAAEREGIMLVCVTLNAPDDWNDHKKMLDFGFELLTGQ